MAPRLTLEAVVLAHEWCEEVQSRDAMKGGMGGGQLQCYVMTLGSSTPTLPQCN